MSYQKSRSEYSGWLFCWGKPMYLAYFESQLNQHSHSA